MNMEDMFAISMAANVVLAAFLLGSVNALFEYKGKFIKTISSYDELSSKVELLQKENAALRNLKGK